VVGFPGVFDRTFLEFQIRPMTFPLFRMRAGSPRMVKEI
jgi:hypothetical protein